MMQVERGDVDFEAAFGALPGLYLLLTPSLTIIGASDAYLEATRTDRKIIGRSLFEVFPDSRENAYGGASALRASLERVIRSGAPDVMPLQRYDVALPDGTHEVRYWTPTNSPVFDRTGKIRWVLHRVADVTAALSEDGAGNPHVAELRAELVATAGRLVETNEQLQVSERRLQLALEVGRMAVWHWSVARGDLVVTPDLNALLGYALDQQTTFADLLGLPDRQALAKAAWAAADRGEQFFEYSFKRRHPETGELRTYDLRAEFLRNDRGEPTDTLGIIHDVTEQREADERQELLMRELNHRVRNNLAIVQSMATRTLKDHCSEDALRKFLDRLRAFARAHDVLTQAEWGGAYVEDIVLNSLKGVGLEGERCRYQGPRVRLEPRLALSLGLALHELGANASKYGALSVPSGKVEIAWRCMATNGGQEVALDWKETGGPPVSPPSRRGFGTQLMERIFPRHVGELNLDYRPSGLVCRISLKLD